MQKVLVTGSSGFLGKSLIKRLSANGVEITALNSQMADLRDCTSLRKAINHPESYDHIFHLAVWTQAGTFCDVNRGQQWIVNQQINTTVLDWWQKYASQAKLISLGTSVSYTTEKGLIESEYMDGIPTDKFYSYAMCKRMLYVGMQCLHYQYGMNYLHLVPSTLYGPGYHTDGREMHFIYDLIRKILNGVMHQQTVTLWGDGEQRRELIYVDDFIDIMLSINEQSSNDLFNIGGGMDHSIKDFARIICDITGYDFNKIQFDTQQYVGARSKILDIEKYTTLIGRQKNTDLRAGIGKTIDWILENKNILLA